MKYLKYCAGFLILFFVIKTADIDKLLSVFKECDLYYFAFVLLSLPFLVASRAFRFMLLMNKSEKRITFSQANVFQYMCSALNMIIPGSAGDVAAAYFGYKFYGHKEEMLTGAILDKITALCGLFILSALSSMVNNQPVYTAVFSVFSALMLVVIFQPRLIPFGLLSKIAEKFNRRINIDKIHLFLNISLRFKIVLIVLSLIMWILTFMFFYLIILCVVKTEFISSMFIAPMVIIGRFIPISPNGLGTQEAIALFFFRQINIGPAHAVAIALINRVAGQIIPAVAGALIILSKKQRVQ